MSAFHKKKKKNTDAIIIIITLLMVFTVIIVWYDYVDMGVHGRADKTENLFPQKILWTIIIYKNVLTEFISKDFFSFFLVVCICK